MVLKIMHDQCLFAKLSKILYLVHIIGKYCLKVYLEKIKAIIEWSGPKNLIELRRFIGICTYFREFVRTFSQLTSPITYLTKIDAFKWHKDA